MNIGERLKKLRKELGLTQAAFAARIGSVQNTVTGYESGRRNPSVPVIALVCREFNVREEWLRTGDGPMFPQKEPEPLDLLLKDRGVLPGDLPSVKSVVESFLELDKPSRDAVIQFVQSCAEKLNAPTDDVPGTDAALAEKVAALERQNRELMARLEAIEKEDAEKETAGAETGAAYISRYR